MPIKELNKRRIKMSDDIDRANDEILNRVKVTLGSIKIVDTPKNKTNKCLWCEELMKENDGRRWCSSDCRDEHIKYANKI